MVNYIFHLAVALIAGHTTHYLSLKNNFGRVRASSLLTLVFCLITNQIDHEIIPALQSAFFGASFVGMASPDRLSRIQLTAASIIFSLIHVFLLNHLKGIGGALGFSAFISCLFTQIPLHRFALLKFLPRR